MRDRLFDLIAAEIPDDIPVDRLPDVDAIVDRLLAAGVIVPPCKVGDVVYCIRYDKARKPYVKPLGVHTITVWGNKTFSVFTTKEDIWNRSAFATKEEAEKALKERREG